jgi:hypothetical protein
MFKAEVRCEALMQAALKTVWIYIRCCCSLTAVLAINSVHDAMLTELTFQVVNMGVGLSTSPNIRMKLSAVMPVALRSCDHCCNGCSQPTTRP